MQLTISISISEAQNQLRTGHQDIRTYFSDTAALERSTNETLATATTTPTNTTTDRIGLRRTELRQRPQQPRDQLATTLTNICRPRYQDIRNFLTGATGAVTTTHATQTSTEETIAPTDTLVPRCRAIRNRLQPPQQTATEETIAPTVNLISRCRAIRNRLQPPRSQVTQ
jgi:hypothetical protein